MSNKTFIFETLNDVKGMSAKKDGEFMTLSGVFGVCGVRNNNNRVYETSNYSKMVSEMKKRIKEEGGIPGELEHPQMMNITLENISHKITDINIDENGVVSGSITLLNTPKGKIAQAIVEGGLPLYISSRATGCVDQKTGAVTLERLATYDLVGSPGFSQAKLHLNENQIAESINENIYYITEKETKENNIEQDMDTKEILERLESLENAVKDLQQENEKLRESAKDNIQTIAEGVQNWIVEEFSPMLQKWIVEEYGPETKNEILESVDTESIMNDVKTMISEKVAPAIQDWIVEEYSPMIQSYLTEEYSPTVEKWIVEEIAPGIQNWITEEFSPVLDEYMTENIKTQAASIVTEAINESKKNSLSSIEDTLKLLEGMEVTKPTYQSKTIVTESANEPMFIAQMPAELRPKWDMASKDVKESITRRAKLYNFNNEGATQRFWESINFDEIKPTSTVYEGLDQIEDQKERRIRESLRKWMKK